MDFFEKEPMLKNKNGSGMFLPQKEGTPKSKYEEKIPALNIRVQAALQAHCNDGEKGYSRTYSYEKKLNLAPASTFPNENLINDTLSETLKNMFEDEKLLSCLSQ